MKELVLASNNKHKQKEIQNILTDYKILTLEDIGFFDEIEEDGNTFEENSLKKAKVISKFCKKDTIADDSGLCIEYLNNEPGVYSARYSKEATDEANIEKVLKKLSGKKSPAKFISVISLVKCSGEEYTFRGEAEGMIITEKIGTNGFGYDPIFYVKELDKTYAQLNDEEKNAISHRKKALTLLCDYLKKE